MTPDRCSRPRCRNPIHIISLGRELCEPCWGKDIDRRYAEAIKHATNL